MRIAETIEIVRGRGAIQRMLPIVERIASLWGQAPDATDLNLSLIHPDALKKFPVLVLVRASITQQHVEGYCAAALLFEYQATCFNVKTRVYSSSDSSGRRNLFAEKRPLIAALICRELIYHKANIVHLAFCQPEQDSSNQRTISQRLRLRLSSRKNSPIRWAIEEKQTFSYLPLLKTFDETLARIGQRTRSNLRYYRRRAEREIGCQFLVSFDISLQDFLDFNKECMYARSTQIAEFRYRSLKLLSHPYLCGARDRTGRWLAIAGGRRRPDGVEIDWQMNRNGIPHYSISTVLRSYLIEDEVRRGSNRFYIDQGTPQAIGLSFQPEFTTAITVCRKGLLVSLLEGIIKVGVPEKNFVRRALLDKHLLWRRTE